jgi:acyl carrier protein
MEKTNTKIKTVMAAVFEIPVEMITDDSSTDNIEVWDSLRHMNLILALEEEFGITLPDEEVGNLVNFKIISLIVHEQQK